MTKGYAILVWHITSKHFGFDKLSVSGTGLADLTQLETLRSWTSWIARSLMPAWRALRHFRKLRVLDLLRSRVTDECCKDLSQLTELQAWRLYGTRLTDHGISKLRALVNLKELRLNGTQVTVEAGIELGRSLPECSIQGTRESITTPWFVPAPAVTQNPISVQPQYIDVLK